MTETPPKEKKLDRIVEIVFLAAMLLLMLIATAKADSPALDVVYDEKIAYLFSQPSNQYYGKLELLNNVEFRGGSAHLADCGEYSCFMRFKVVTENPVVLLENSRVNGFSLYGMATMGALFEQVDGSWVKVDYGNKPPMLLEADREYVFGLLYYKHNVFKSDDLIPSAFGVNFTDWAWWDGKTNVVSIGATHSCAITSENGTQDTKCWGRGVDGQLGDGTVTNYPYPVSATLEGGTFIAVGNTHSCAIDNVSQAWCWGTAVYGQLGYGGIIQQNVSKEVNNTLMQNSSMIGTGSFHTCAIDSEGVAYCWGYNYRGECGVGSTTQQNNPVAVSTVLMSSPVTFIDGGHYNSMAVDENGDVFCWGYNDKGQCGDNSKTQRTSPVAVSAATGMTDPISVAVTSWEHSCALEADGSAVWCWGNNGYGKLGDGTHTERLQPVAVNLTNMSSAITHIAATERNTFALDVNGQLWCWGYSLYCGTGNIAGNYTTPTKVSNSTGMINVTSLGDGGSGYGGYGMCAIDHDGQLWCWGYATQGSLADKNLSNHDVYYPQRVEMIVLDAPVWIENGTCSNSTKIANFTYKNEQTGEVVSGNATIVLTGDMEQTRTINNTTNFSICKSEPLTDFDVDVNITYSNATSGVRNYIMNITNSTAGSDISLYLLDTTYSSAVQFITRNQFGNPLENRIQHYLRYFPATETYLLVAMGETDANGAYVANIFTNGTTFYKIISFGTDGTTIEKTWSAEAVYCIAGQSCDHSLTLDSGVTLPEYWTDVYNKVTYNCSYNNGTKTVACTYADGSGVSHSYNLTTRRLGWGNPVQVCSEISSAASGTLLCTINDTNTSGSIYSWELRHQSEPLLISSGMLDFRDISFKWVAMGLAMLIILAFGLIGLFNPVIGFILVPIGIAVASWLQFIDAPVGVIAGLVLMGAILARKAGGG